MGCFFLLSFSLVSGLAQQNGPVGRSGPPASVPPGSAKRQITLDVVVTDKSGKPFPGLQRRNFTLLDNKQPQEITSFHAVEGGIATADPPVEVILIVDEVNAAFNTVSFERREIAKFLKRNGGQLARPVSFVFFSDTGTTIGKTSSRDGNGLVAELNEKRSGLRPIGRSAAFYGAAERLQLSLEALGRLAAYEATRPGRKLVVWISPGWPLLSGPGSGWPGAKYQQGVFDSIVGLSDGLRRARMTLYLVDPLGLADSGELRTSAYLEFLTPVKTLRQAQAGNLALQVIANQSGGLVLNLSNGVEREIEMCAAEANAFYVLTFDGLAGDGPNEYHALEIKIDQPGLTARTRSGYYAQPEQAPAR
jgi:VWFA-related protein